MNSKTDPLAILRKLVAIPSQNPMGHPTTGDGWLEMDMSDWLQSFFESINVTHEYHEIESGRGNVVAFLPGASDRPTVLLDAHQDTVPVAGMTIDPFSSEVRDGRLYGRGSCDVKGSMAVILAVVARLASGDGNHSSIIVSCTCDEERGQKGARDLASRLSGIIDELAIFGGEKPEMAIVSEPTELLPVVAHKGTARWKIETRGVAAHSSKPAAGENAIYKMASVLRGVEGYCQELSSSSPSHPLCGTATMSVGTICGGASVNIVPESCRIEIDRRVLPGETPIQAMADAQAYLDNSVDVAFEFLPPDTMSNPLSDSENAELARRIIHASQGIVPGSRAIGVPFTTHAPRIAELGIPTVVFGPGSIAQAHTKDEWIEIAQLEHAAEILNNFLTD